MSGPGSLGKSFDISKRAVWEAYRKVKANRGGAGVDGQSMAEFERELKPNLYKVWNRLSSGTFFPPPVKAVPIPKPGNKGVRMLGVPTVADRIAQTVVAAYLEPEVEPRFHPDSYGYRPGRSAGDAVAVCRRRCWEKAWVLDLDIRAFFGTVPHELILRAVTAHTDLPWVVLYVRRWLTAPLQTPEGALLQRDRGTPQGSAISPLLTNLFMHYAFDRWLAENHPTVEFERYCDDAVVHCVSQRQAHQMRDAIAQRLAEVGLELHPDKTQIVYCGLAGRHGPATPGQFTFLGFTFRPRLAFNEKTGQHFTSFLPAVSPDARQRMGRTVRSWRLARRTDLTLQQLAKNINRIVAGWINYYGRFYKTEMIRFLQRINRYLTRWACRKYKRLRRRPRQARNRLIEIATRHPGLFAHWHHGALPT